MCAPEKVKDVGTASGNIDMIQSAITRSNAATHRALTEVHRDSSLQLPQPLQPCRKAMADAKTLCGSLIECAGAALR